LKCQRERSPSSLRPSGIALEKLSGVATNGVGWGRPECIKPGDRQRLSMDA
jgi:hypothetical protein